MRALAENSLLGRWICSVVFGLSDFFELMALGDGRSKRESARLPQKLGGECELGKLSEAPAAAFFCRIVSAGLRRIRARFAQEHFDFHLIEDSPAAGFEVAEPELADADA